MLAFTILATSSAAKDYVDCMRPFEEIFTYEELLTDEKAMKRLYRLFGNENMSFVMEKKDSQENTILSQINLGKMQGELDENIDDIISFLGVPKIENGLDVFKDYLKTQT